MPPNKHALLGPSGAHRWLVCTPSAKREEGLPDTAGAAAEEGTLAHAIVETKLDRVIAGEPRGTATQEQQKSKYYTHAMETHTDFYCDFVEELYNSMLRKCPDALLESESKVEFTDWVPDGHGTTDTVIIADDELVVIDFKYGKNVLVEAENNPQLRLYALGAYKAYCDLYDIRHVHTYIVQPRVEGVSSEDLTIEALLDWADNYVKPRAEMAAAGLGEAVPGEHQCRFCKAQAICKEFGVQQLELLRYRLRDPGLLTPEDVADVMRYADHLVTWVNNVKKYALGAAMDGERFPGLKLVAGRATRRITDEAKAAELLEGKYGKAIYELKGLGALEDVVGKNELAETLGDLLAKPDGKPTLVSIKDKRPELVRDLGELFKD